MCSAARQPVQHPHKDAALYPCIVHPTRSRRCCIAPSRGTLRRGWNCSAWARLTGRATITRLQPMSCKRFGRSSRAIFAHGFARARCGDCGHDVLIAYSCRGRVVCPPCNTRRMALTAAHLTDHVFPHYRLGNGCCRSRSGCATSCNAMGLCSTWCCASSCGSLRKAFNPNALGRRT